MGAAALLALVALLACTGLAADVSNSDGAGYQQDVSLRGAKAAEIRASSAIDAGITTGSFKFTDVDVHYKLAKATNAPTPPRGVLFLHGARFTSEDWVTLGTLQVVQALGWHAMAIDLPGYGQTRALPYADNNMRAEVVQAAFKFLGTKGNILVSPSMSGKFAMPYVDRYPLNLAAWVAIAPAGLSMWGGPVDDAHSELAFHSIYGASDPLLPDAKRLANMFRKAESTVIQGAGHACYMDKPEDFHAVLRRIVTSIPKQWRERPAPPRE